MASFTQPNFGAIAVTGHYEKDKHTLYVVEGALSATQTWRCEKRLAELRALHDAVVAGVGRKGYEAHFKGASFASRGGMPGTTKKLDKWCKRLFAVLPELPEPQQSFVLSFLGAPAPVAGEAASAPTAPPYMIGEDAAATRTRTADEEEFERYLGGDADEPASAAADPPRSTPWTSGGAPPAAAAPPPRGAAARGRLPAGAEAGSADLYTYERVFGDDDPVVAKKPPQPGGGVHLPARPASTTCSSTGGCTAPTWGAPPCAVLPATLRMPADEMQLHLHGADRSLRRQDGEPRPGPSLSQSAMSVGRAPPRRRGGRCRCRTLEAEAAAGGRGRDWARAEEGGAEGRKDAAMGGSHSARRR